MCKQMDVLLQRLGALQHVYFQADDVPESKMGWSGRGEGAVTTHYEENVSGLTLRLYESGLFYPAREGAKPLRFSNCFCVTVEAGKVFFSHERFGKEHAVPLFELTEVEPAIWQSVTPHFCGNDVYQVQITLRAEQVAIEWMIDGPRKKERICYQYR